MTTSPVTREKALWQLRNKGYAPKSARGAQKRFMDMTVPEQEYTALLCDYVRVEIQDAHAGNCRFGVYGALEIVDRVMALLEQGE